MWAACFSGNFELMVKQGEPLLLLPGPIPAFACSSPSFQMHAGAVGSTGHVLSVTEWRWSPAGFGQALAAEYAVQEGMEWLVHTDPDEVLPPCHTL